MAMQYATGGLLTKGSLATAGRLGGRKLGAQTPQAVLNKSVVITPAQRTGQNLGRGIITKGLRDIQARPKVTVSVPKPGPAPVLGKIIRKTSNAQISQKKKIEDSNQDSASGTEDVVSTAPQTTTTTTTTTTTSTEGEEGEACDTDPKTSPKPEKSPESEPQEDAEKVTDAPDVPPQPQTQVGHSEVTLGQPSRTAVGFTRDAPITGDARTGIVKPQIQTRVPEPQKTTPSQNQMQTFSTQGQTGRPTASLTPLQSMSNLLPPTSSSGTSNTAPFSSQTPVFSQTSQPLFQPFLQQQNTPVSISGANLGSNVAQVAPQVHPTATIAPSPPYLPTSSPVTSISSSVPQFSYAAPGIDQNATSRGSDSPLNLSQLLGASTGLETNTGGNTSATNTDDLTHHSALEYLNYTLSQSSSAFRRPDYPAGLSADIQSLLNSAQQPIPPNPSSPAPFAGYQPSSYQYGSSYRPTTAPYTYTGQYPHYPGQYPLPPAHAHSTQSMGQYGGLHPSPTAPYNSYAPPPPPTPPHARPPYTTTLGGFAHGPYPPM